MLLVDVVPMMGSSPCGLEIATRIPLVRVMMGSHECLTDLNGAEHVSLL